jgi:elongation factor G
MVLLWLGIRPKTADDTEKLGRGLAALTAADPTYAAKTAADGIVLLGADSEERLEAAIRRLVDEFHVEAAVTGVEIDYKEALTRTASGEAKYTRQSGGRGQYGHVRIYVEPGDPGSGFVFENVILGGAIPAEFVEPIADGVREARGRGVLAGYPIEDVRVTLYDGSYHDVDSSPEAFKAAAAQAFVDAAKKAHPVLLEPVMVVMAIVPEEYASRIAAMLKNRRGVLLGGAAGEWPTISAQVPLSETFGLESELRARTAGRGLYHVRFLRYQPAARLEDDGDRDTPVREPKHPRTPPHVLRAAVPEPIDDAWGDDEPFRPYRA